MFKRRTSQPSKMDMIYEIYPIDTLCECSRFEVLKVAFVYCSLIYFFQVFHSIQETCNELLKIVEKYQLRLNGMTS